MSKMSPFVISPYIANSEGILVPELPGCCIGAEKGDVPCQIYIHSSRDRKTGPAHPLVIIYCKTHDIHMTIYPPGFGKYRRQPLVDVSPSGKLLSGPNEKDLPPLICFQETKFEAALDAAAGRSWDRKSYSTSGKWWQTQCRHLDECCRLLGIHPGQNEQKRRETLAHVLDIPQFMLEQEKTNIAANLGYRAKGKGIVAILQNMTGNCLVERLSLAGHIAGLWGCPFWWQDDIGQLSPVPFQRSGTSSGELFFEARIHQ